MNNAIICGIIPEEKGGASSSVFFKYLEGFLKVSNSVELFIISDKITEAELKVNKLIFDLNSPNNLKVTFLQFGTSISYLPWEKSFYLYKIYNKPIKLDNHYDNLIVFDIDLGYLKFESSANRRVLWLGDLHFELEWFNFFENSKFTFYGYLKMIFLFLNKLLPYIIVNSKFDKIVCCSLSAQIRLNRLGIKAQFLPFPYPSIRDNGNNFPKIDKNKKFLFYGNLIGSGSKSGLKFLFEEILPAARNKWGRDKFSIVIGGRTQLPEIYNSYLKEYTEVSYIGYISDLKLFMRQFTALLIPISLPLGNRTRVLDGLSFGIPVVGHKALSNGNPYLIDEVNCLLSDSGNDFINKLERLCGDSELYNEIINNGLKTFDLTYNPQVNHSKQLIN